MARRREIIVLDSSVVVKWFSKEAKSDEAVKLLDFHTEGSIELAVSDLQFYEVANALRYKPDYDAGKLKNAVSQLFRLHLKLLPLDDVLLGRAGEIAYDGDVTMYDAIPVALAESQRTVCITADEETQYKRLKRKSYPIKPL